ncbi:MAG: polymerase, sigma-24 subunit, subfamily [Bryobacterales bacterium]|nr:polymerase, sigma-24 subunit, subfamily [Bryobacterales bacterium]
MRQVRDGDAGKLALLFDRHHRPLFRFFLHLTGNREGSEDLVQEVFYRILKYRQSYNPETSFRPWLYQIARNTHTDYAAKHKAEVEMPEDAEGRTIEFRSLEAVPEERFRQKQEVATLRKALAALSVEKREVLVMSRFQDLKYDEIASILKCETGAVKVRVYRALRELGDRFFALRGERAS